MLLPFYCTAVLTRRKLTASRSSSPGAATVISSSGTSPTVFYFNFKVLMAFFSSFWIKPPRRLRHPPLLLLQAMASTVWWRTRRGLVLRWRISPLSSPLCLGLRGELRLSTSSCQTPSQRSRSSSTSVWRGECLLLLFTHFTAGEDCHPLTKNPIRLDTTLI